eukprot:31555-Eustigmatos_ZCMA.PRE.1
MLPRREDIARCQAAIEAGCCCHPHASEMGFYICIQKDMRYIPVCCSLNSKPVLPRLAPAWFDLIRVHAVYCVRRA